MASKARKLLVRDTKGAVFVEFLIAFLPVYVFFLCLVQLTILFSVRLLTEHAAINAARAAAVVIGDERDRYNNEEPHVLTSNNSQRGRTVYHAALLSLTPLILNGLIQNVDVFYPRPDQPDGPPRSGTIPFAPMTDNEVSKVRVRVEVDAACRIGFANQIVCPSWADALGLGFLDPIKRQRIFLPTKRVRAEAIYPYQGARYVY